MERWKRRIVFSLLIILSIASLIFPTTIAFTQPTTDSIRSSQFLGGYRGTFQNWWDTKPLPPLPEPLKQSFLEYIHRDFGVDDPQSFQFTITQLADGTRRSFIEIDGMVLPLGTTVAYTYYPLTDPSQPPQVRQQWSLLVTPDGIPYGEVDLWYTADGDVALSRSRLALIPTGYHTSPTTPFCFDYHIASHPSTSRCPIYAFTHVAPTADGRGEGLLAAQMLEQEQPHASDVLFEVFLGEVTLEGDADFTLNFSESWNLFSVPKELENNDVVVVMGDFTHSGILTFVGDSWLSVCGDPVNCDLQTIDPLFAYWIISSESRSLPFFFKDPPAPTPTRTIIDNQYSQLVGVTSLYPIESEILLSSIAGSYYHVWACDTSEGLCTDATVDEGNWTSHYFGDQPDMTVRPGDGLWVSMNQTATLEAFECKPIGAVCSLHNECCGQVCTDGLCGAPDIEVTPAALEFVLEK